MKLNAKQYDVWYSTPFGKYADKLEKELIFGFLGTIEGKKILDAGCGTRNYTIELAKRGAIVIGLDSSLQMLKYAKKKANIQLVLGSMLYLPFKSKSFDSVVSVTALEFCLRNEEKAAEEMRRTADKIVVGVLNKWSLYFLEKRIKSMFIDSIYSRARFYSIFELKDLLGNVKWNSTLFFPHLIFNERLEKFLAKFLKPFGAFIAACID